MEKSVVLIHAGIAVLIILYLLVRILAGLFGLKDSVYQEKIRQKFRIADWTFAVILAISGAYPLILPGQFELYHLIKIFILFAFIGISRYGKRFHFTGATLALIGMLILAGYVSVTDTPRFPKAEGTFAAKHPEINEMPRIEQGKVIFNTLCIDCHGTDGKKGRFGAADLTVSKLSVDDKIGMVTKGSPLTVMRSFSEELSSDEIEAVVDYIHSLVK